MKKMTWMALFLLMIGIACSKAKKEEETTALAPAPSSETSTAVEPQPSLSVANLVLNSGQPNQTLLTIEVAKTVDERLKGLQGRENLGDDHGMWFVFDADVSDSFWMKNTTIPLDIIFVDKEYQVVKILENTTPNSETLLDPAVLYRYALEVNAGTSKKFALKEGSKVEFRVGPP